MHSCVLLDFKREAATTSISEQRYTVPEAIRGLFQDSSRVEFRGTPFCGGQRAFPSVFPMAHAHQSHIAADRLTLARSDSQLHSANLRR